MKKSKHRFRMLMAGVAVIAVAGALGFVFTSSARGGETGGGSRSKAPPREMPDGIRDRLAQLKTDLGIAKLNPQQKPEYVRNLIDSLTTVAMAWHQSAPEVFAAIRPMHDDPRGQVRQETAFALGFLGSRFDELAIPAMETLMEMAHDNEPKVRARVAEEAGALGRANRAVGIEARIVLEKLRQDADVKVRQAAEKGYPDIARRYPAPR
jgi:hypothetical protein